MPMETVITQNYHEAILWITYRHCAHESPWVAAAVHQSEVRAAQTVCLKCSKKRKRIEWEREREGGKKETADTIDIIRWIGEFCRLFSRCVRSQGAARLWLLALSVWSRLTVSTAIARSRSLCTPLSPAQSRLNTRCYIFLTNVARIVQCDFRSMKC